MARKVGIGLKLVRFVKSIIKIVLALVILATIAASWLLLPGIGRMLNSLLGIEQSWDNSKVDPELNTAYYTADFRGTSFELARADLDRRIAEEGIVLLKNEGGSLPLEKGTVLSFFSANSKLLGAQQSMASAYWGVGSSYDALNDALADHGLSANTTLQDFYVKGEGSAYAMGPGSIDFGDGEDFSINECPLSVLATADGVLDSVRGTTPVFVLRRVAGEGRDMPRSMYNHADNAEDKQRSYLEPDSTELEILRYLNDNYDNVILVVSTASAVELDWVAQFPNIRSILFVPGTGTNGGTSLAGILAGDINPSGHTVDTFAADASASPAAQNFGDYQYTDSSGNLTKYNYVSYAEGIYVGYRYYETRYEDKVMGWGKAGDYDYASEVVYPFGHGLSYTTFEYSNMSFAWEGNTGVVKVTVTNTGSVAGRDAVELYAQTPYTWYDVDHKVEKSSVVLVGYEKTRLLAPGETQKITVRFDWRDCASYDYTGAKTYILDYGNYYFALGNDAHDALNNILAAKGKTANDGMTADGNPALVASYTYSGEGEVDDKTFAADDYSGVAITNQLDDAAGDVAYLTRNDWEGTFPKHDGAPLEGVVSTWGNEINGTYEGQPASLLYGKVAGDALLAQLDSTDSGNPNVSGWQGELVYGADNGLVLIDLRSADYDDQRWDKLLDELTPEDYDLTIARAGYGTEHLDSVGKPFGVDTDTAAGLIYGNVGSMGGVMYCSPIVMAMTWNKDLAYEYGHMIGTEGLLGGATGWYAPSMNIHRTPYSGRNGEYFSEDGFISGTVASLEVKGAAEKGMYATIKHFAFNDQENHRGDREGQFSIATWLNEQSARELYLKPFEMCMKAGDVEESYIVDGATATRGYRAAAAIMTAFNRVGATWTGGSYPLITGIVRNEWDFDGWIITDNANTGVFMDAQQMIEAGADSKLTYMDQADMWRFDKDDPVDYKYGREAVKHLLYTMANSSAMQGAAPGSVYKYGLQKLQLIQYIATGVGALLLLLIVGTAIRNHRRRKEERMGAYGDFTIERGGKHFS